MHVDINKLEARLSRLLDPKTAREIIEASMLDPDETPTLEGQLMAYDQNTATVDETKAATYRIRNEDNRLHIEIGRTDGHFGGMVVALELNFDPEGRVRSPFGELDIFVLEPVYGVLLSRMRVGPEQIEATIDESKGEHLSAPMPPRSGGTSLFGPSGFVDNTMVSIGDLDLVDPIVRGVLSGRTTKNKSYELHCAQKPTRHERRQIARLIALGFRRGHQPDWKLDVVYPP